MKPKTEKPKRRPAAGGNALAVTVEWQDATVQLPDSDTTVMLHLPTLDDPVWMGYHDGETWRLADGEALDASLVDHWADLPEPPPLPWHNSKPGTRNSKLGT